MVDEGEVFHVAEEERAVCDGGDGGLVGVEEFCEAEEDVAELEPDVVF